MLCWVHRGDVVGGVARDAPRPSPKANGREPERAVCLLLFADRRLWSAIHIGRMGKRAKTGKPKSALVSFGTIYKETRLVCWLHDAWVGPFGRTLLGLWGCDSKVCAQSGEGADDNVHHDCLYLSVPILHASLCPATTCYEAAK